MKNSENSELFYISISLINKFKINYVKQRNDVSINNIIFIYFYFKLVINNYNNIFYIISLISWLKM